MAFWVIFGVVVVGGVTLLAHKIFGKTPSAPPVDPNAALGQAQADATSNPTPANVQRVAEVKQAVSTPVNAFPLKSGSHGTYVQNFQDWLMGNNVSALPKYGDDGIWGSETQAEAISQSVPVPVTQAWYNANIVAANNAAPDASTSDASAPLANAAPYVAPDPTSIGVDGKRFDNETALHYFCCG